MSAFGVFFRPSDGEPSYACNVDHSLNCAPDSSPSISDIPTLLPDHDERGRSVAIDQQHNWPIARLLDGVFVLP